MPELRNEPPEPDHDRVIDALARLSLVEKEIDNLRDWRHDTVAPAMMNIQAQQRQNTEHIGKLAQSLEKLVVANAAFARLPDDFRDHQIRDDAAFDKLGADLADGLSSVHSKLDTNRAERSEGQKHIILWVAGLMITGLAAVIGAQWALLASHLPWH